MTPAPRPLPLAVTMGDPAGVGPEIVAKLFRDRPDLPAVVYGDPDALARAQRLVGGGPALREVGGPAEKPITGLHLCVVPTSRDSDPADLGRVTAAAGRAAHAAIVGAARAALAGEVRAMVTAPVHKAALHAAGVPFPGHTEILADLAGTSDFTMLMANDELRVVLTTIHVPLKEAIAQTTRANVLRVLRLTHRALRGFGLPEPRLAVAGLNPHAGEDGLFGREDLEEIAPAVRDACAEGVDATGPLPADTVFMRARRGEFDVVVAQYHDQGLIPVKYLGLDRGVNVTLGLPFLRTSVDHGTAFDLAGTGRADVASLATAVRYAEALAAGRWPAPEAAGAERRPPLEQSQIANRK